MYIAFIGSEACAIHGLRHALERTYELEEVVISDITSVLKYQREHGRKPIFMANNLCDIKLYYNSIVNNL